MNNKPLSASLPGSYRAMFVKYKLSTASLLQWKRSGYSLLGGSEDIAAAAETLRRQTKVGTSYMTFGPIQSFPGSGAG